MKATKHLVLALSASLFLMPALGAAAEGAVNPPVAATTTTTIATTDTTTTTTQPASNVSPAASSSSSSVSTAGTAQSAPTTTLPASPESAQASLPALPDGAGPEAWYYLARKMEKTPPADVKLLETMYALAYRFGKPDAAAEAGRQLVRLYADEKDYPQAIAAALDWLGNFGSDWDMYRSLVDLYMSASQPASALKTVSDIRRTLPSAARNKASELAWLEYSARSAMGDYSWAGPGVAGATGTNQGQPTSAPLPAADLRFSWLKTGWVDSWTAKILTLYASSPGLPPANAQLALFRVECAGGDYVSAAASLPALRETFLSASAPRVFLSEAGKAFLNSGNYGDGIDFFSRFFPQDIQSALRPSRAAPASSAASPEPAQPASPSTQASPPPTSSALPSPVDAPLPKFDPKLVTTERLWVAAFYIARLAQASGRSADAAIVYLDLTDSAFSDSDADTALWYWLDITMKQIASLDDSGLAAGPQAAPASPAAPAQTTTTTPPPTTSTTLETIVSTAAPTDKRSLELATLIEASYRWKNPSYFSDIVGSFMRGLLKQKSWDSVVTLCVLVGDRVDLDTRVRLYYLSGRLVENSLAALDFSWPGRIQADDPGKTAKTIAAIFFNSILSLKGADEYYRTMASWRLGQVPPFMANFPQLNDSAATLDASTATADTAAQGNSPAPPANSAPQADPASPNDAAAPGVSASSSGQSSVQTAPPPPELDLVRNYLKFGLDDLAAESAISNLSSFDASEVAAISREFYGEKLYYPALRLASNVLYKGSNSKPDDLYGIVYPLAWEDTVAKISSSIGIPEALTYAIIRSESMFNPKAVSRSGAVGLSQLMPSTAAQTAAGIKLQPYDLTDPKDNLTIGFTYYSYMLGRFSNRPMRAMFAYNAGPGRMANWNAESGELPDDILLETLHLSEPRQYAKNILQAALAYGRIHFGIDPDTMLDYLVNGEPIPAPVQPLAPQTPAASVPPAPVSAPPAQDQTSSASEPAVQGNLIK